MFRIQTNCCCFFSIWTTRKTHDVQGYFPGLSRTLSFNFQDFPGPKWFSRTFPVMEFSREKSRTLQEAWNPATKPLSHTDLTMELLEVLSSSQMVPNSLDSAVSASQLVLSSKRISSVPTRVKLNLLASNGVWSDWMFWGRRRSTPRWQFNYHHTRRQPHSSKNRLAAPPPAAAPPAVTWRQYSQPKTFYF